MDSWKFDGLLQETLEEKSRQVSMSDVRKQEIFRDIAEHDEKEETKMRIGFKKKVALVAAAMCLTGTVAALAAGKITGYYSGTSEDSQRYGAFAEISNVEAQTGFSLKAAEQFENGYQFAGGAVTEVVGEDENGNVVESFPEVRLHYKKGDLKLTLTAQKVREDEEFIGKVTTSDYEGRVLLYKEDQYMFVPPEYEPSEEELQAQEARELYISYGSDEVEHVAYHFMQWDDEGTRYLLMASGDGAPGQEEMAKMAQEVIGSQKR